MTPMPPNLVEAAAAVLAALDYDPQHLTWDELRTRAVLREALGCLPTDAGPLVVCPRAWILAASDALRTDLETIPMGGGFADIPVFSGRYRDSELGAKLRGVCK